MQIKIRNCTAGGLWAHIGGVSPRQGCPWGDLGVPKRPVLSWRAGWGHCRCSGRVSAGAASSTAVSPQRPHSVPLLFLSPPPCYPWW